MQNIPREILCEIFAYPMTLEDYLNLRLTSKQGRERASECVTQLVSPEGQKGTLISELVLEMSRIETIAPEYPIKIFDLGQLLSLAEMSTLREATFEVSDLEGGFYQLILSFFERRGSRPGPWSFTFIGDVETGQVTVAHDALNLIQTHVWEGRKEFYQEIGQYLSTCACFNELGDTQDLEELSCLQDLYLSSDEDTLERLWEFSSTDGYLDMDEYTTLETIRTRLKACYITYPAGIDISTYLDFTTTILYNTRDHWDGTLPMMEIFFPIAFSDKDINLLLEVCPNLTEIWLIASSIEEAREEDPNFFTTLKLVESLPLDIIIFDDLAKTVDEEEYVELFERPLAFIRSNWFYPQE
jgi:hypothetical protein